MIDYRTIITAHVLLYSKINSLMVPTQEQKYFTSSRQILQSIMIDYTEQL